MAIKDMPRGNPNIVDAGGVRFQIGNKYSTGKAKGTKNFATRIRDLIEDDKAVIKLPGGEKLKNPGKLIVQAMTVKAQKGDVQAATWLAKFGYGEQIKQDVTSNGETVGGGIQVSQELANNFAAYLLETTKVKPEVIEVDNVTDTLPSSVSERINPD